MIFKRRKRIQDFKRGAGVVKQAVAAGWDALQGTREAIEAECGFPPRPGERIYDYAARAADVPRAAIERAMAAAERGEVQTSANPEAAKAAEFIQRMAIRLMTPSAVT